MAKCKSQKLLKFDSLDKLVDFFDTHDIGEYWNEMPKARFEVDIKKRTHFSSRRRFSRETQLNCQEEKTPSEVLIKSWLKEKFWNTHKHLLNIPNRKST